MRILLKFQFLLVVAKIHVIRASICGCKSLRPCYQEMVEALQNKDEVACIEEAALGDSTMMVYLNALKKFCGNHVFNLISEKQSFEGRYLHEVTINNVGDPANEEDKPTIIVEAGQQGGGKPAELALYLIQQLVACQEYNEMIQKVRWVILPCTNPDGQEYARFDRPKWKKNVRLTGSYMGYGVDISRNFDTQWGSCEANTNSFSPIYPGPSAASENETIFIKNVLQKHKNTLRAYLSIRRDGHSIMYPYAYTGNIVSHNGKAIEAAADIAAKVNQRAGSIQIFLNDSIYRINGKPHCGHSVDYAHEMGIPFAYEMRVFLGMDLPIISQFQALPRGYETNLRIGYFSGIRELYNVVINDHKKPHSTN